MSFGERFFEGFHNTLDTDNGVDFEETSEHHHIEGFHELHLCRGVHGIETEVVDILALRFLNDAKAIVDDSSSYLHFGLELVQRGLIEQDGGVVLAQNGRRYFSSEMITVTLAVPPRCSGP